MDFSSQLLRGEKVVWSASLEKQRHDEQLRPAPPIAEVSRPNIRIREKKHKVAEDDPCADVGEFHVRDREAIRQLREKWSLKL
jgi:hypothetical protein